MPKMEETKVCNPKSLDMNNSKKLRLEIEARPGSAMEKTTNLLDLWHERNGRGATVEVLVDALLKLHLEESTLLLKDMRDLLTIGNPYSES
ncbi:hypothetical protein BSL78_03837 [Apostichopus japonicus]|uniref:Death domain-containing protein n=1 Tax=Stichopus japonicus TaxID=307972 RepID=A0A2G8LG78_STIJA|nr:hypothetical protein BSL78_03837 [Apostichopus japonicus]